MIQYFLMFAVVVVGVAMAYFLAEEDEHMADIQETLAVGRYLLGIDARKTAQEQGQLPCSELNSSRFGQN